MRMACSAVHGEFFWPRRHSKFGKFVVPKTRFCQHALLLSTTHHASISRLQAQVVLQATAALTGKGTAIAEAVAYMLIVPVDKVQVNIYSYKVRNSIVMYTLQRLTGRRS